MPIRDYGFKKIFEHYEKKYIGKLLEFHRLNGGLSRYVKIRYFYEDILNKKVNEKKIEELANRFSKIMKKKLIDKKYLIYDTIKFIGLNYKRYNMHIVSGSDEKELHYLCKKLEIDKYFISINGSPTAKDVLVENIICKYSCKKEETILIGDSINDYNAAKENGIRFYGYNNKKLLDVCNKYIISFKDDFNE